MYYDDQTRRFNLLSGLLAGTVLGAGLALLLRPEPGSAPVRRLRRATDAFGRAAGDRWDDLREEVRDAARERLRRER